MLTKEYKELRKYENVRSLADFDDIVIEEVYENETKKDAQDKVNRISA